MDFDRLRALVWTIDEGSVTAAARRLHRTQPAVTRLLKTLEESVGGPLIDRAARPLAPTPAGRRVVRIAREILQMADVLMAPGNTEPVPRIALRLGMSRALLWHLSRPVFSTPPKHLRELDYRVRSGSGADIYRSFCRKEIDCAAVLMPLDWSPGVHCSTTLVRKEPLVIIAPKPPQRSRVIGDVFETNSNRWILSGDGCGIRSMLARTLAKQGHRMHVRYEVDAAPHDHISLVAAGVGVGIVPASTLKQHRRSSAVVTLPIGGEPLELGVWLLASEAAAGIAGLQAHLVRVFGGSVTVSSLDRRPDSQRPFRDVPAQVRQARAGAASRARAMPPPAPAHT